MPVTVLLLAAGASSRMRGADKLMEQVEGKPLIRRQAEVALATGCPVIVTLPPDRPERAAALDGLGLTRVVVPDAAEGLSASLRAGIAVAGPGPVLVLLADLPEISADDLGTVLTRHPLAPERILRGAAEDGTPGHPVLFPEAFRSELAALTGDGGARELLKRHAAMVDHVLLPGRHAVTDLDTPEDWVAWRAGAAGRG